MKRISLRVPDHQHAALSRALAQERVERGNRYSLNDLCVRVLVGWVQRAGVTMPLAGAPSPLGDGTMHILRTPPPPPVPRVPALPTADWRFSGQEEPQPERSAKPQPATESESDAPCTERSLSIIPNGDKLPALHNSSDVSSLKGRGPAADGADPDANESAITDTTVSDWVAEAREHFDKERMADEGGPDGHGTDA